jgi:GNAT superfamily N-acetyltransferase
MVAAMTPPPSPELTVTLRLALPRELELLQDIDDDASDLYSAHGLAIELGLNHPFVLAERTRWLRSAKLERTFLAIDRQGTAVGFAALDLVDGAPYLDQLAVRKAAMRRGIGGLLLGRAAEWAHAAGGSTLWLSTYDHLPFNRPYYERHGYVVVPEAACGPGIREHLDEQRRFLPEPGQRVVMRRSA